MIRSTALLRGVVAGTALVRLARAAGRRPAVSAAPLRSPTISVVIPARDEAGRIGPLLDAVVGAPGVHEVIVVDDQSTDGTAEIAAGAGAAVVAGRPLPPVWVGKAWALQQGLDAAGGDWIVSLDADSRPDPALPGALVARAIEDGLDLVTVAGRFECPTAPLRWLHPALLTTLLYRGTAPGTRRAGAVHRRIANGQCMAFRRAVLAEAGGFATVAHHTVEDVALVRGLATAGFNVDFVDATALLRVRMYESAGEAWTGWSRSIALPGVDPPLRRAIELGVVTLAQAAPLVRLLVRRADVVDLVLLAARVGTLVGAAAAYDRRGPAYWASPLADPLAVLALARGVVARRHRWRGRSY
jgi:dolichol-phosphate mannosyltransferase